MTYWIFSQGLPVPARTDRLLEKQRVKPLTALTKSTKISDMEENSVQIPEVNDLKRKVVSTAYHNVSNNERQSVKNANDIMTSPVISLFDDTLISEAWLKFQDYRFRHFPVTNRANQIIGIVSDRDIFANTNFNNKVVSIQKTTESIAQIMVHKVITASADTSIHEICQVMFNQHIGALPIVDEKHQLLGLITRSDILRVLIKNEAMEFWI
jgi:CBS-domain-containing membrane protein